MEELLHYLQMATLNGRPPVGGNNNIIEAINTAGLSSSKQITLERIQENNSRPKFQDLILYGKTAKKNSKALALIIGVSDYERTSRPCNLWQIKMHVCFHDYAAIQLGVYLRTLNILTLINTDADRIEIGKRR